MNQEIKVITKEQLNQIIDQQENGPIKKGLLVIKSSLRRFNGELTKQQFETLVQIRREAENLVGERLCELEDFDDIFEESAELEQNLPRLIKIVFGDDDDE